MSRWFLTTRGGFQVLIFIVCFTAAITVARWSRTGELPLGIWVPCVIAVVGSLWSAISNIQNRTLRCNGCGYSRVDCFDDECRKRTTP